MIRGKEHLNTSVWKSIRKSNAELEQSFVTSYYLLLTITFTVQSKNKNFPGFNTFT